MGWSISRLGGYGLEDMGWRILCKLQIFLHYYSFSFCSAVEIVIVHGFSLKTIHAVSPYSLSNKFRL